MKRQLIAGFLLVALLLSCFAACTKKDPQTNTTDALYSEHFSVNRGAFAFFYYEHYYSFCNQYSGYLNYFFDAQKPLSAQKYSDGSAETVLGEKYSGTWADYFLDKGIDFARQALQLSEAALSEGMNFSEADEAKAIEFGETMRSNAAAKNVSLAEYISGIYGKDATYDDLLYASKLSSLAARYMTVVTERVSAGLTDGQVEDYYAEHLGTYETAGFYQYPLEAKKTGDAAADEAAIARMAEKANDFKKAVGVDDFVQRVKDDLRQEASEAVSREYYDMLRQTLSSDYSGEELENEIDKQLKTLTENLLTGAVNSGKMTGVTYESAAEFGQDGFAQWLYHGGAKVGDIRSIISEDEDAYYIILVCMTAVPERNDQELYRVGVAIFADTDAGIASAQNVYEAFRNASERNTALLEQLGRESGAIVSENRDTYFDGYYNGVYHLQQLDEWISAAGDGDVGLITAKQSFGSTEVTYNIVVYKDGFVCNGWFYTARQDLIRERCNDWYREHSDPVNVSVNDSICRAIS